MTGSEPHTYIYGKKEREGRKRKRKRKDMKGIRQNGKRKEEEEKLRQR